MKKCLSLFFTLLILFSCYSKKENTAIEKAISSNTYAQVMLTLTTHLKLNKQAEALFLEKTPAAEMVSVYQNAGTVKSLADKKKQKRQTVVFGY